MKNKLIYIRTQHKKIKYKLALLFSFIMFFGCNSEKDKNESHITQEKKQATTLPFTSINLIDMKAFKPTTKNWNIVGDVLADRTKKQTFSSSEGTGILLNTPQKETKDHLFTNFNHGDIELEFDVMMPVKSNSGIYFQGRYEIQLFDSWGIKTPKHSDIGGIYQRWNDNAEKGKEGYE